VVSGQIREILRCAQNYIQDVVMMTSMLMRCMGMFFIVEIIKEEMEEVV